MAIIKNQISTKPRHCAKPNLLYSKNRIKRQTAKQRSQQLICKNHTPIRITGRLLFLSAIGGETEYSWRIGIDEEKKTALVQAGLFRRSRNPIFLGMIVTLIGVFLTIPNALTLLFLAVGFVLIQIQVRLEEEFLTRTQGEEYAAYRRQVRRWL